MPVWEGNSWNWHPEETIVNRREAEIDNGFRWGVNDQTGTIYFIILNVLILEIFLLLLYRNQANSKPNRARTI